MKRFHLGAITLLVLFGCGGGGSSRGSDGTTGTDDSAGSGGSTNTTGTDTSSTGGSSTGGSTTTPNPFAGTYKDGSFRWTTFDATGNIAPSQSTTRWASMTVSAEGKLFLKCGDRYGTGLLDTVQGTMPEGKSDFTGTYSKLDGKTGGYYTNSMRPATIQIRKYTNFTAVYFTFYTDEAKTTGQHWVAEF